MANKEAVNLVTGYTGQAHIKSEDDAMLNQFFSGGIDYAINLTHSVTTTFNIECDVINSGRFIRSGGQISLDFTTPASGFYRYDGVYAVYEKNQQGIESAEIIYCEGEQSASNLVAQMNIGQPQLGVDIPADTVSAEICKIYEIAWNNEQAKTITQSLPVRGDIDFVELTTTEHRVEQSVFFDVGEQTSAWVGAGFITNAKKGIRFTMPLGKFIPYDRYMTPTSLRVTLRQNGFYVLGDGTSPVDILSISTLTVQGNMMQVTANLETEMASATNNDAVGIAANFDFNLR